MKKKISQSAHFLKSTKLRFALNKRGISPIIATVLLICMTVLIGVLILAWAGVFSKGIIASAEESKDKLMVCNAEVSLNIKNACIDGTNVKMLLENAGSREIIGIITRVIGISGGYQEETETGIPEASIGDTSIAYNPAQIGSFKQIEVLPKVDIKGKTVICGISDSETVLENC